MVSTCASAAREYRCWQPLVQAEFVGNRTTPAPPSQPSAAVGASSQMLSCCTSPTARASNWKTSTAPLHKQAALAWRSRQMGSLVPRLPTSSKQTWLQVPADAGSALVQMHTCGERGAGKQSGRWVIRGSHGQVVQLQGPSPSAFKAQ